jgi:hypothetical protein
MNIEPQTTTFWISSATWKRPSPRTARIRARAAPCCGGCSCQPGPGDRPGDRRGRDLPDVHLFTRGGKLRRHNEEGERGYLQAGVQ